MLEMWSTGQRAKIVAETACSGAPRTKEYERALSLLSKGQHPKSSVFTGHPSPISDAGWGSGIRTTATCFSVCASCPVLEPSSCLLHAHAPRHVSKKTTKTKTHTHTHTHHTHSRHSTRRAHRAHLTPSRSSQKGSMIGRK